MVEITKGYVSTARGQVHYREAGRWGGGLPVVMLHQTASSSQMFEALMPQLSAEYFVFAPDTPGFGESFHPVEPGSIEQYAASLLEACRARGIERCYLFGHHTGASIAVEMLGQQSDFAEKLVLSGPCLLSEAAAQRLAQSTPAMVLSEDGSHLHQVWERIRRKDPQAPLSLRQREAVLTLLAGPRWSEGYHAVFRHHSRFAELMKEVQVPTLVFAGERDTVADLLDEAYELLRGGRASHVQKQKIAGETTYLCDSAPSIVVALLKRFFPVVPHATYG